MTLTQATFILGLVLALAGRILIWQKPWALEALRGFPRHRGAAAVLMVLATAWVLWNISQLGEADFGNWRPVLLPLFFGLAVVSFIKVPDFIGVRALAVLVLLSCGQLLQAAFMQEPVSRLLLVTVCYGLIGVSIYLGVAPYRLQRWIESLLSRPAALRGLGFALGVLGLALWATAFTY